MKNRLHRYDIIKPRPKHGHKFTEYKIYNGGPGVEITLSHRT